MSMEPNVISNDDALHISEATQLSLALLQSRFEDHTFVGGDRGTLNFER